MSTLRDIRNKPEFQRFSFQLHGSLKTAGCTLSLQQLQSQIAKALGAKTLESANLRPGSITETAEKPTLAPLWAERAASWHVIQNDNGTLHHNGTFVSISGYREHVGYDVLVLTAENARIFLEKCRPQYRDGAKIVRFADAFPALFSYLQMDATALQAAFDQPDSADIDEGEFPNLLQLHAHQLNFHCVDWHSEVEEDNTQLSYFDWLSHQFEVWTDDFCLYNLS